MATPRLHRTKGWTGRNLQSLVLWKIVLWLNDCVRHVCVYIGLGFFFSCKFFTNESFFQTRNLFTLRYYCTKKHSTLKFIRTCFIKANIKYRFNYWIFYIDYILLIHSLCHYIKGIFFFQYFKLSCINRVKKALESKSWKSVQATRRIHCGWLMKCFPLWWKCARLFSLCLRQQQKEDTTFILYLRSNDKNQNKYTAEYRSTHCEPVFEVRFRRVCTPVSDREVFIVRKILFVRKKYNKNGGRKSPIRSRVDSQRWKLNNVRLERIIHLTSRLRKISVLCLCFVLWQFSNLSIGFRFR